ncbi:MAG: M6 family metalloprotease domain-containing protein [Polyangiales bacterium]
MASVAHADIVWEGERVSAWPDIADLSARATQPTYAATGFYPAPKGTVYGLTILVDFSDQPPAFTKAEVEAWLNAPGYAAGGSQGSVRDYFLDVSNGMVDFQNDVFGFYRAEYPKSHYEAGSDYRGSDELWAEVVEALDPMIDFSKYDNDKNGRTEAISLVYAGPSETWGQGLWPHASGSRQKRDDVTLTRYMLSQMGERLELYVFAHESGHMLFGWPDLYGFGDYCLMGNAQNPVNPAGINDFYRADQGWIPQIDIKAETNARYSATPNGGGFRFVNPKRSDESFFWSNVQNTGRFKAIRGSGIFVMHFDKAIGRNDPPNPLSLAVVEADGRGDLAKTMWPKPGSAAADFFVQGGNAVLSDTSMPAARWNDGSSSGLKLYDVSESGPRMTFAVGTGTAPNEVLDGGVPPERDADPTRPGVNAGASGGASGTSGASGHAAASAGSAAGSGNEGGARALPVPAATGAAGVAHASGHAGVSAGAAGTHVAAAGGGGSVAAAPMAAAPVSAPAPQTSGCSIPGAGATPRAAHLALWLGAPTLAAWRRRRRRGQAISRTRMR